MAKKEFNANIASIHEAAEKVINEQALQESTISEQMKAEAEEKKTTRKTRDPHINLKVTPEQKLYIEIFSNLQGLTETVFIQTLIENSMKANAELYAEALKFRANFKL